MEIARLTVDWELFASIIAQKIQTAESIIEKERQIKTAEGLADVKQEVKTWHDECLTFLKGSFSTENNRYLTDFRNARSHRFNTGRSDKHVSDIIKEEFEDLEARRTELWEIKRMLNSCDFVINKNEHLYASRQKYSTEEKLDFVLDKLYDLYDKYHYPLKQILEGNAVVLATNYEERELGTYLEQNGFISLTTGPGGVAVQLTTNGRLYVEEKRKKQTEDYNDLSMSSEEVNAKVDSIVTELRKLGLGQEIIYNEIEELKDLYIKLNKKHWTQTLKGKLVDIGLSQVLDKDVLKEIYQQLTNHPFKLP